MCPRHFSTSRTSPAGVTPTQDRFTASPDRRASPPPTRGEHHAPWSRRRQRLQQPARRRGKDRRVHSQARSAKRSGVDDSTREAPRRPCRSGAARAHAWPGEARSWTAEQSTVRRAVMGARWADQILEGQDRGFGPYCPLGGAQGHRPAPDASGGDSTAPQGRSDRVESPGWMPVSTSAGEIGVWGSPGSESFFDHRDRRTWCTSLRSSSSSRFHTALKTCSSQSSEETRSSTTVRSFDFRRRRSSTTRSPIRVHSRNHSRCSSAIEDIRETFLPCSLLPSCEVSPDRDRFDLSCRSHHRLVLCHS